MKLHSFETKTEPGFITHNYSLGDIQGTTTIELLDNGWVYVEYAGGQINVYPPHRIRIAYPLHKIMP